MALSRRFRISEFDTAFVTAHAMTPFLLPVNFGYDAGEEPLSTIYSGARPIHLQAPAEVSNRLYPERARAAGMAGEVDLLCTLTSAAPQCVIEREEPQGWEFGATLMTRLATANPLPADQLSLLPGDQIRFSFRFQPE